MSVPGTVDKQFSARFFFSGKNRSYIRNISCTAESINNFLLKTKTTRSIGLLTVIYILIHLRYANKFEKIFI